MYHYHVSYWDSLENKIRNEIGLVAASSYNDVVNKITDYYGEKEIDEINIARIEDILTEEELKDIFF